MAKAVFVDDEQLVFDDGSKLYSDHETDCCEHHYLSFADLSLDDFEGLDFNLSSDDFFERVENFGIRLLPVNGQPISVPGYGTNNGCYSERLDLVLERGKTTTNSLCLKTFDITECQEVKEY